MHTSIGAKLFFGKLDYCLKVDEPSTNRGVGRIFERGVTSTCQYVNMSVLGGGCGSGIPLSAKDMINRLHRSSRKFTKSLSGHSKKGVRSNPLEPPLSTPLTNA